MIDSHATDDNLSTGIAIRVNYYFRVAEDLLVRAANRAMSAVEYTHLGVDRLLHRQPPPVRYTLIRSLGVGFFTEVMVVLDALLFCRLSGRIPVTHWGDECRFGDLSGADAFTRHFYEPLSPYGVADLIQPHFRYYPTGWNRRNLAGLPPLYRIRRKSDVTAGNYRLLLDSSSDVIVVRRLRRPADFAGLMHGLLADDAELGGKCLLEIYRFLAGTHLHPRPEVTAVVDAMQREHLGDAPFLAVHVRGADKVSELAGLDVLNDHYDALIAAQMRKHGFEQFLLLTDDSRIAERFRRRYGRQVVMTAAQRTDSEEMLALYRDATPASYRLGLEVMADVYLATRARVFIGNAASMTSMMVGILGTFTSDRLILLAARDGVLNFDAASYDLCTVVPVVEAHYHIIHI